jgi:hypothetical protein
MERPHESAFWYVLLFVTLACGVLLVTFGGHCFSFVPQLSSRVRSGSGGTLVGAMLISAAVAHLVIYWLMRGVHSLFDIAGDANAVDLWPPAILGVLESSLYTVSLVVGRADFIAFWVAVKTAGGWVAWSGSVEQEGSQGQPAAHRGEPNKARRRFYSFLIGNSLVIISALVTYGALKMWALRPW